MLYNFQLEHTQVAASDIFTVPLPTDLTVIDSIYLSSYEPTTAVSLYLSGADNATAPYNTQLFEYLYGTATFNVQGVEKGFPIFVNQPHLFFRSNDFTVGSKFTVSLSGTSVSITNPYYSKMKSLTLTVTITTPGELVQILSAPTSGTFNVKSIYSTIAIDDIQTLSLATDGFSNQIVINAITNPPVITTGASAVNLLPNTLTIGVSNSLYFTSDTAATYRLKISYTEQP